MTHTTKPYHRTTLPISNMATRPKGLMQVALEKCRLRHLSRFTEKQYLAWIRQFIHFHQKSHPRTMGEREIESGKDIRLIQTLLGHSDIKTT